MIDLKLLDNHPLFTVAQAAQTMNVSIRSVYQARELQRCRPDLAKRCEAGEVTILQALRIAKPEKYARRDKVEQWLASFAAWTDDDQRRALDRLIKSLSQSRLCE